MRVSEGKRSQSDVQPGRLRAKRKHRLLMAVAATAVLTFALAMLGLGSLLIVPVVLGSVIGLAALVALVRNYRLATLGNVLAITLLNGYFVGYLLLMVAQQFYPRLNDTLWYVVFAVPVRPSDLLTASAVVLLAATLCILIGTGQKPILASAAESERRSVPLYPFILGLGLVGLAYGVGDIGYMGVATGEGTSVPVLGSLAQLVAAPLGLTALYYAATEAIRRRQVLLIAIFLLAMLSVVPMGRRMFLFSIVLAPLAWWGASGRRPSWGRLTKTMLSAALVLFVGFTIFTALRQYENVAGTNELSTGERLQGGLWLLTHRPGDVVEQQLTSAGPRTSSDLAYLGLHVNGITWRSELHGRVALLNAQLAVPRAFWQDKEDMVEALPFTESLAHPAMGLDVFDGSNTILTEGYADFGPLGALAYPVILLLVYVLYLQGAGALVGSRWKPFLSLALAHSLFFVERNVVSFLVDLRNLSLLVIIVLIVRQITSSAPAWKSRRRRLGLRMSRLVPALPTGYPAPRRAFVRKPSFQLSWDEDYLSQSSRERRAEQGAVLQLAWDDGGQQSARRHPKPDAKIRLGWDDESV